MLSLARFFSAASRASPSSRRMAGPSASSSGPGRLTCGGVRTSRSGLANSGQGSPSSVTANHSRRAPVWAWAMASGTVCTGPDRQDIDRALVANQRSIRDIAQQYGLTPSAIERHKNGGHIADSILRAQGLRDAIAGDDLLAQARLLQEQAFGALADAGKDKALVLKAIHQCRENIRLLGEVLGKLKPGGASATARVVLVRYNLPDNGRARPPVPLGRNGSANGARR